MTSTVAGQERVGVLGTPVARIEGPQKVDGSARYAAEYPVDGVTYAWVVQSPVVRGTLNAVSWGWAVTGACRELTSTGSGSVTHDSSDAIKDLEKDGKHAFGAHFAEVRVDACTGSASSAHRPRS